MSVVYYECQCDCGGVLNVKFNNSTHERHESCCKCGKVHHSIYDFEREDYDVTETGGFGFVHLVGTYRPENYSINSKSEAMNYYERAQRNEFNSYLYSDSYIYFYDPILEKGKVVWGGGKPNEHQEASFFDDFEASQAFDSLLND